MATCASAIGAKCGLPAIQVLAILGSSFEAISLRHRDKRRIKKEKWLPRRDSNPNKQNQNLRCYHYTTRQSGEKLRILY